MHSKGGQCVGQSLLLACDATIKPAGMTHPSSLDDRDYADFAWGRYRKILKWMTAASVLVALLSVAILWWSSGPLPWIFVGLTFAGVFATMMMAAALMGLIFLSNGSGHDAVVSDMIAGDLPQADDWEKGPE